MLLEAEGFTIDHEAWQRGLHAVSRIAAHHAWSYQKDQTELDLHNFAIPLNRLRGDDKRLWAASQPVHWRGLELRVPCREHALVLAISHGLRGNDGESLADWAVDACHIIDREPIDWELVLAESQERQLQSILHTGLSYLADVLNRPVPEQVLATLASARDEQLDAELIDYASSSIARTEPAVRRAFAMSMRRFVRGTPPKEPTQAATAATSSCTPEFPDGVKTVWLPLPHDRIPTDWVVVRVGLEVPVVELRGECILRMLLPGLPVGSVPLSAQAGTAPAWRQSFMFPFHCGFLAARGIDRIGLCLLRDGQPLTWPGCRKAWVDFLAAR